MNIPKNLQKLKESIPEDVKIVLVTKTRTTGEIMEAYNAGHRLFGENKVQELLQKKDHLPEDIEWHMVGHLQSNKVKYIAPFIGFIHGVDSLKLLKVINKEAVKNSRVIDCLLQIHIAREETKFGMSQEEVFQMLDSPQTADLQNIRLRGLMGMATFTDKSQQIREEFEQLADLSSRIRQGYMTLLPHFGELSMGMSSDYDIAIEKGSTMIRVGSVVFGERTY